MDGYRAVLRKVGLVLTAVGLIDIAFMAYCIANGLNYSSSFNIFALIAGIFLVRGSLYATRLVTWFAAFFLAAFLAMLVVLMPLLQPADLWVTQFRLDTTAAVLSLALGAAVMALLWWVYAQLRNPLVVQARIQSGQAAGPPRTAFMVGLVLVVGLAVTMHFTLGGETSRRAKQLAEEQLGSGYKFHVTAMQWAGRRVHATVTAYNEHEIKAVQVEWEQ